jgi:bifunctional non-homologous end joining protein LigD
MYHPGVRTRDWTKTKHWKVEEFLIGGWSPPRHGDGWGLLIGEIDERGDVRYRGRVEFGITRTSARPLKSSSLRSCAEPEPFAERQHEPDAVFVEPRVLVEIRYLERTSSGSLRHAAFRQVGGHWKH